MSLTNRQAIASALLRWNADFSAARIGAELAVPEGHRWSDHVATLGGSSSSFASQIADAYHWFWAELDPTLVDDPGQPVFATANVQTHSLTTKKYNKGFEVDLDELRKPAIVELYAGVSRAFGQGVALTAHRLFYERLTNGHTATFGLGYDGVELYSDSHPGRLASGAPTTFDNNFALALNETNLTTVILAALAYRDSAGNPVGNMWLPRSSRAVNREDIVGRPYFHILAGPALASTLHTIADINGQSPGIFAGTFSYQITTDITDDAWYVKFIDQNSAMPQRQPLAYMSEGEGIFASGADRSSEQGRIHDKLQTVVKARIGFAFKDWHVTARSKP